MKKSTVGDIISSYKNEDRIESLPHTGCPKMLTGREETAIIRKVQKDPRVTATRIATEVLEEFGKRTSPSTVRRVLYKAKYHRRKARRKPYISSINRIKRLQTHK